MSGSPKRGMVPQLNEDYTEGITIKGVLVHEYISNRH